MLYCQMGWSLGMGNQFSLKFNFAEISSYRNFRGLRVAAEFSQICSHSGNHRFVDFAIKTALLTDFSGFHWTPPDFPQQIPNGDLYAEPDYEKCAVCGDKSAGRHYGVLACLGCKTFFRRALVRRRRYFCESNGQCDIQQRSGRQSCRACRLKACFDAGMQREAIQAKRDSVGIRRRHPDPAPSAQPYGRSSSLSSGSSSTATSPPVYSSLIQFTNDHNQLLTVITELTKIDVDIRRRKTEHLRAMTEAMKLAKAVGNEEYPKDLRMVDVPNMPRVTSGDLMSLVEWARTLQFFQKLPVHCRTRLLRRFAINHLIIEAGYCTASSDIPDIWMFPDGTCMPRDLKNLSPEALKFVSAERRWRQENLYREMTERCITDVATPMRRLRLFPEELVTLKVIMLCQYGIHMHCTEHISAGQPCTMMHHFRDQAIKALFAFYESKRMKDYEERFGNILLLISGIVSSATLLHENYQLMRFFRIVPFDKLTHLLLFDCDDDQPPSSPSI